MSLLELLLPLNRLRRGPVKRIGMVIGIHPDAISSAIEVFQMLHR
jgi:hypothetical protein